MDTDIIISLIVAIVVTAILIAVTTMVLNYIPSEGGEFKSLAAAAQIVTPFILIVTVVMLYRQLGHIQEQNVQAHTQNELQRAVASKSSIQALNEVLLDEKQEDFLRFVFPDLVKGAEPHVEPRPCHEGRHDRGCFTPSRRTYLSDG